MHKRLALVGHIGSMLPAEPRDTANKKAAESIARPAAKASEEADLSSTPANDPTGNEPEPPAFSDHDWEAVFPGQRVLHRRVPNRQRLAMRFAQGMVRAVNRGDYSVAVVFFNRLHGIPRADKGAA